MRIFLALGVIGLLTGCAANSDMTNNNFPAISVAPTPTEVIGVWTGSMGPYLTTMKFESSGNGLMCYSWNGKNTVARIKYDGSQIRISDGTRLDIEDFNKDIMVVKANYYMGSNFTLYKDDDLKSADPYCVKNI